ncbi:Dusp15 [Symbiodinium necroappetens]|uniref:Dusp15 protein n=1 Tax=Symbiodinium necroappetens TaxID=1628268 RepID=A0A812RUK1_9DINO|nr:Dusp15 [Symbiodinium necroappetens]
MHLLHFLHSARADGCRCLIYGTHGRSRPAALAMGYIMADKGLSFAAALKAVRRKYPLAHPSAALVDAVTTLSSQSEEAAGKSALKAWAGKGAGSESAPLALTNGSAKALEEEALEAAVRQLGELLPVPADLREALIRHSGDIERPLGSASGFFGRVLNARVASLPTDGTATSEPRTEAPRLAQCYLEGQEQLPECIICGRSSKRGGTVPEKDEYQMQSRAARLGAPCRPRLGAWSLGQLGDLAHRLLFKSSLRLPREWERQELDLRKLEGDAAVINLNRQKQPLHYFDYFLKMDWEVHVAVDGDKSYRTADELIEVASLDNEQKAPASVAKNRVIGGTVKIREFSSEEIPADGQWPLLVKVKRRYKGDNADEAKFKQLEQLCEALRERLFQEVQKTLFVWLEECIGITGHPAACSLSRRARYIGWWGLHSGGVGGAKSNRRRKDSKTGWHSANSVAGGPCCLSTAWCLARPLEAWIDRLPLSRAALQRVHKGFVSAGARSRLAS